MHLSHMSMRVVLLIGLFLCIAIPASAQSGALHDQEVTWRSYDGGGPKAVRVRVFETDDERRPQTVVVDDRAENGRRPVTDDVAYVADTIGRELGFDPTTAVYVFRFTESSFVEDGRDSGKAILVKATFQRTPSGALAAPTWRLLTPEALEDLTDRQMR